MTAFLIESSRIWYADLTGYDSCAAVCEGLPGGLEHESLIAQAYSTILVTYRASNQRLLLHWWSFLKHLILSHGLIPDPQNLSIHAIIRQLLDQAKQRLKRRLLRLAEPVAEDTDHGRQGVLQRIVELELCVLVKISGELVAQEWLEIVLDFGQERGVAIVAKQYGEVVAMRVKEIY